LLDKVNLQKNIDNILGNIYLEKIPNKNSKAKKTNIIWCVKKKGTN